MYFNIFKIRNISIKTQIIPLMELSNVDLLFDDTNAHVDGALRSYTIQTQPHLLISYPHPSYPSEAKTPRRHE